MDILALKPLEQGSVRSQYTFFPKREEQECLNSLLPKGIEELFSQQPEMIARFQHELWRTGKYGYIILTGKTAIFMMSLKNAVLLEMGECGALAISSGENHEVYNEYVRDVLTLMSLGSEDKTIDGELSVASQEWVEGAIGSVMAYCDKKIKGINNSSSNQMS